MDKSEKVLTATNIHREFTMPGSSVSVLTGVELSLNNGDMASVSGASGVGKSTLMHILGGLDRPTKGEVNIAGETLTNRSEASLARLRNRRVGFVFQNHYLLEDFSALENVMMPMLVGGRSVREAALRGEHLLEQVGLSNRAVHRPREISGGEQQRVAVARALANSPEIVLADEPTGNLDMATGRILFDLLLRLNSDNGVTFFLATHNQELARECRRRFSIEKGKINEVS